MWFKSSLLVGLVRMSLLPGHLPASRFAQLCGPSGRRAAGGAFEVSGRMSFKKGARKKKKNLESRDVSPGVGSMGQTHWN